MVNRYHVKACFGDRKVWRLFISCNDFASFRIWRVIHNSYYLGLYNPYERFFRRFQHLCLLERNTVPAKPLILERRHVKCILLEML